MLDNMSCIYFQHPCIMSDEKKGMHIKWLLHCLLESRTDITPANLRQTKQLYFVGALDHHTETLQTLTLLRVRIYTLVGKRLENY